MKNFTILIFPFLLILAFPNFSQSQTTTLIEFTDANFQTSVLDNEGITVVEFWAEWCGPCRMVDPVLKELAEDYGKKINVGKLDVDFETKIPTLYNVRSIPTILIFKNGEVVDKYVGVLTKETLEKMINVLL